MAGERRILKLRADWLPGYDGAQPVRIGHASAALVLPGTFGYLLRARLAARRAACR